MELFAILNAVADIMEQAQFAGLAAHLASQTPELSATSLEPMEEEVVTFAGTSGNVTGTIPKVASGGVLWSIPNVEQITIKSAAASVLPTALLDTQMLQWHAQRNPTVEVQATLSSVRLNWSKVELSATLNAIQVSTVQDLFAGNIAHMARVTAQLFVQANHPYAKKLPRKS